MKQPGQMTKAELVRRVRALEARAPAAPSAREHRQLVHDLQVHQVELETQNRELREVQQLVELSRDRYADLYDFAPVGFLTLDRKGVIRDLNLAAAGMLGRERARLIGEPFHLHVVREDAARFREHLRRLSDEIVTTEVHLRRKDGRVLPVMLQTLQVYDRETQRYLARTSLADLTARVAAEQALRDSAELNRGILSSLDAHIAVLDSKGNIIAVNEAWNRFARANGDSSFAQTGVGSNYLETCRHTFGAPDDQAKLALAGIQAVLKGTLPGFSQDYPCHSPQEKRWFAMSVTPLTGGVRGAVVSHLDISQRRKAEDALAEQEARLHAVLDSAVEAIITIDERGTIESLNPAAEKMFGYSAGDAIGQNVSLLMPSPHREAHDRYLANYRDTGERKIIGRGREVEGRRKDGSTFPLDLSVNEVWLSGRRIFTGFLRDITRRKQAEDSLRASEERFRSLSEASPLGVCMSDVNGKCTYTNPRWQEMSGLSAKENLGDGWTRIIHPEDRQGLADAWSQAVQENRELLREFRIVRPDGCVRWIRARSNAIRGADGTVIGHVGVDEDVTERKREERRRQLQFETSRLLATTDELNETMPKLLQTIAETLEWDIAEFWEAAAGSDQLHAVHVWHAPDRKLAAFVKQSVKRSFSMLDGLPSRVLATRQPEWIPEIAECAHFGRRAAAAKAGLRSVLAVPIQINERTLGVLGFLARRQTDLESDLVRVFASLGSQIGLFIERKQAEEALREVNEFGKQVIDGAEAGIVVYDRKGRVVVWNPFMERLSGYRAEEVLGRRTVEVFPFQREQQFETMFQRALAGEIFESADAPFEVPEKGKRGWKAERFAPLRNARQEIIGVIVAVRDVTERRRLEAELLEISDREQRRIGHDLHDGLGQQLTALEMKSFLLQEELAASGPVAKQKQLQALAREICQALRESVTVTRSLARGLAPVNLKAEGLVGALRHLTQSSAVPGRIACRFVSRGVVPLDNVQTAEHLFCIAQEAVNNAVKHARARRIQISLTHRRGVLHLEISDDGRGVSPRPMATPGMGMEVMRHRAHFIGASLVFSSRPGHGVNVCCSLPLKKHEP